MLQLVVLLLLMILGISTAYPGEVVYGCAYDNKQVHLTFDDGPSVNNNNTDIVLNILKEFNISATFFLIGNKANASIETINKVKRMVNEGHTIGSHSFTHPNLMAQNFDEIKRQIDLTTNVLESITGYKPNLFRAPFGGLSDNILSYLKAEGYTAFQWNMGNVTNVDWYYSTRGGGDLTNEAVLAMHSRVGGIITMHDNHQSINNGDTLRHLIQILTNDTSYIPPFQVFNAPNFKIVSLLECLGRSDVNDIPDYYKIINVENDDDLVYWAGSIILISAIIISCVTGFFIGKRKYTTKPIAYNEQTQLIKTVI